MSTLTTLIEQHHAFLHFQDCISKAIYNRDEPLLLQLKQASQDLFFQIEDNRKGFLETVDSNPHHQPSFQSDLAELVQVMDQAHRQVQKNEKALQVWLEQMKSDAQHHRKSQSPRGVLATYVQQKETASERITKFSPSLSSSDNDPVALTVPTPSSPWIAHDKDLDTMGHQVNHQS